MKLYAESILIGSQWQADKTILINADGVIEDIVDGKLEAAERVEGAIIPGMVNCHSHAFQRAFAGFSEYRANQLDSFWSWRDIMYRFVAKLSPQDVNIIASYLYMEMLKAGYTSVAEFHYLHKQVNGRSYDDPAEMSYQVINAASQAGIAITHLPVLYTYGGFGKKMPSSSQARFTHQLDEYCRLVQSLHQFVVNESTVKLGIAPHSLRAVSKEQLEVIVPLIKQFDVNAPIHIHIAEQTQEVIDSLAYSGQRPVEWLFDNQPVDSNWCLIHATHLTEAEMIVLARSEAVVGICSTTEANLGDGVFPAAEYLSLGGKLSIGSDSHIAVNVADELRMLEYCQRLTKKQRAVLSTPACQSVGEYLYLHAAKNGANVINQNVGEINIGRRADLVVLDTKHPSLFAKAGSYIIDSAIFACAELPVLDVMVAGRWKVESGRHAQQQEITESYLKVMKKLSCGL